MRKTIIHGENIFVPVTKVSTNGKVSRHKKFIAGHSESGHHHVIESETEFEVVQDKDNVWVRLMAPAKVVHQKTFEIHETLPLAPGLYQIKPAQEYNPFTKVMERQFD